MEAPKNKIQKVSVTITALWWVFGSSVALFSVVAILVATGVTNSFDQSVLMWLYSQATPALDAFFVVVSDIADVIFVTVVSLVLLAITLINKKYYKSLLVVIGMGGVMVMNLLLKAFFERPRPDLWEWIVTETSYSFPSGHATASMALALCIVMLVWWTKWRIITVILAALYVALVGLSRMYLGVHFPTDILGGWLLGMAWLSFVSLCIYYYQRRNVKQRPVEP